MVNYDESEEQINLVKQKEEYKGKKDKIEIDNSTSVIVFNENTIANNNAISSHINDGRVSILIRLFAKLIDCMLLITACLMSTSDLEPIRVIGSLSIFVILIVQLTLLYSLGQTIGKKICKIKIVSIKTRRNGGFIRNCLIRSLLNTILYGTVIYGIVDVLCILREDRRCIHDFIAGTKVVRERSSRQDAYDNLSDIQTETSTKNTKIKMVSITVFTLAIFMFMTYRFLQVTENIKEKRAGNYIESLSKSSMEGKSFKVLKADNIKYGKLTPLVKIVNEDVIKTDTMNNEFLKGYKEKNSEDKFPTGLTPKELFTDMDTIKTYRKNLKEVDDFISKYETDMKNNKAQTDKKLTELKRLNTEIEEETIDKFNYSRKEKYDKKIKEIDDEKAYMKKIDKCFEFMESKQGQYKLSDKEILFYYQSDADEWNKLAGDLRKSTRSKGRSVLL